MNFPLDKILALFVATSLVCNAATKALGQDTLPADSTSSTREAFVGAERLSAAFRQTAADLRPSVVTIASMVNRQPVRLPPGLRRLMTPEQWEQFERQQQDDNESVAPAQAGVGSGIIVSADGFILTNNHVIDDADVLEVELHDGRVYDAEIIGRDAKSDVAVLKIEAQKIVPAKLGDSSQMQVGDWVVAVGSPFGLSQTVTAGIISATNRNTGIIADRGGYEDFLQTDAAINPGNSGGPLVNLRGEVIGINTAINSGSGTNAGVGFAIPANLASRVMQDLRENGRVIRGFLGASLGQIDRDNAEKFQLPDNLRRGVVITEVGDTLPAQKAGLKPGDVVIGVGQRQVRSLDELRSIIALTRPGVTLPFKLVRDGQTLRREVTLTDRSNQNMRLLTGEIELEDLGVVLRPLSKMQIGQLNIEGVKQVYLVDALERDGDAVTELQLRPGDALLELNGQPIRSEEQLKRELNQRDVELTVIRGTRIIRLPGRFR
ncbi:MAG TPA: serine protease [Planctomycetaceae bacterium]|nr:serine protease [Planctomycetaceae bacterium]